MRAPVIRMLVSLVSLPAYAENPPAHAESPPAPAHAGSVLAPPRAESPPTSAHAEGPPANEAETAPGTCILKPRVAVQLGSAVSGVLASTSVDRGDSVTRGQIVARIESSVEQATLALDRMKASNESAIKTEQTDLELNQREVERKKFLVDQKIAGLNALDELETKVREGELRVQQAMMDQHLAELTADRSERALALKQIRSPIDGVVIERKLSAGEFIYEQTSIMTIAQIDPLNVEVVLPMDQYGRYKVGQTVTVHPAAPIGGAHPAKVEVVDPVIDAASETFGVRLLLPNPANAIPAGLRCAIDWRDPGPPDIAPGPAGQSDTGHGDGGTRDTGHRDPGPRDIGHRETGQTVK